MSLFQSQFRKHWGVSIKGDASYLSHAVSCSAPKEGTTMASLSHHIGTITKFYWVSYQSNICTCVCVSVFSLITKTQADHVTPSLLKPLITFFHPQPPNIDYFGMNSTVVKHIQLLPWYNQYVKKHTWFFNVLFTAWALFLGIPPYFKCRWGRVYFVQWPRLLSAQEICLLTFKSSFNGGYFH